MNEILRALLLDDVLVNDFEDTHRCLAELRRTDASRPVIALNFGETWQRCPPDLRRLLADTEPPEHGYQLSFYGDPAFRRYLKRMVIDTESWTRTPSPFGEDSLPLEIAVVWHGTRSAMYDFGRYLMEKGAGMGRRRTPYGLCPSPGWTYRGVFEAIGMRTQPLRLRPENGFAVTREDIAAALRAVVADGGELRWVVINAQQNPRGRDWTPSEIGGLVDLAIEHGAALLVDNAYFGATRSPAESSSAMQMVFSRWLELERAGTEVLYVRSLGKAYHCNGWSLGAVACAPPTLRLIAHDHRHRRGLPTHGFLQQAMLRWLSAGSGEDFSARFHAEHSAKRAWLEAFLSRELDYPQSAYHIGTHAPYALIRLPPSWDRQERGVPAYLDAVAEKAAVLFAPCFETEASFPWVRVYMGAYPEVIEEAFSRLALAGFGFQS